MYERTNNCSSYNLRYIYIYIMNNVTERPRLRSLSSFKE